MGNNNQDEKENIKVCNGLKKIFHKYTDNSENDLINKNNYININESRKKLNESKYDLYNKINIYTLDNSKTIGNYSDHKILKHKDTTLYDYNYINNEYDLIKNPSANKENTSKIKFYMYNNKNNNSINKNSFKETLNEELNFDNNSKNETYISSEKKEKDHLSEIFKNRIRRDFFRFNFAILFLDKPIGYYFGSLDLSYLADLHFETDSDLIFELAAYPNDKIEINNYQIDSSEKKNIKTLKTI